MKTIFTLNLFLILILSLKTANSHEFWIEPEEFFVQPDDVVTANLRIGQMMSGNALGYFPNGFLRFEIETGSIRKNIEGRIGDSPALVSKILEEGLTIIIHETQKSFLTYTDWKKFKAFLHDKALNNIEKIHIESGYEKTHFAEAYSRFAKTLIASGDGQGQDKSFGMETEFVMLSNPFAENSQNEVKLQLLYKNLPRKNVQVEVFKKNSNDVITQIKLFTNIFGVVTIPTQRDSTYMINSVKMRPFIFTDSKSERTMNVLWESLWASIVFKIPRKSLHH